MYFTTDVSAINSLSLHTKYLKINCIRTFFYYNKAFMCFYDISSYFWKLFNKINVLKKLKNMCVDATLTNIVCWTYYRFFTIIIVVLQILSPNCFYIELLHRLKITVCSVSCLCIWFNISCDRISFTIFMELFKPHQ